MEIRVLKIAHVSPSSNQVSETFIEKHRTLFKGEVVSYYGAIYPNANNIEGSFTKNKILSFLLKIKNYVSFSDSSYQQALLERSFKKQGIQLCFAEYGTCGIKVMQVCQTLKIPLVVNFHGYDAHEVKVVETNLESYKQLFSIATVIVSVSQHMTNSLIQLECPPEKIRHLPCFPDYKFEKLAPNYQSNKVLAVGRFVDKKSPHLTLLAFSIAQKQCPTLELNFVGDGPLFGACTDLVNALGIKNVNLPGAIPHHDVVRLFSDSLMFIQHSVRALNGDSEGTPVAVMEASLSGLPLVSTNHAGIPDVVVEGKTGFLVEERDVEAMAQAIIKLYEDRELCEKMGYAAKIHMSENYNQTIYRDKLNLILLEAVDMFHVKK